MFGVVVLMTYLLSYGVRHVDVRCVWDSVQQFAMSWTEGRWFPSELDDAQIQCVDIGLG